MVILFNKWPFKINKWSFARNKWYINYYEKLSLYAIFGGKLAGLTRFSYKSRGFSRCWKPHVSYLPGGYGLSGENQIQQDQLQAF